MNEYEHMRQQKDAYLQAEREQRQREDDAIRADARAQRDREIVAWLRSEAARLSSMSRPHFEYAADAIERGDVPGG